MKLYDTRIESYSKLISPKELKERLPITKKATQNVIKAGKPLWISWMVGIRESY